MENKGIASFWLGFIESESVFDELMRVHYSEDGDFIPSKFARYFSISRYDDTTREAEYFEAPQESIGKILVGFSYNSCIIPQFKNCRTKNDIEKYNCAILLYNYDHDYNKVRVVEHGNIYFEFIGTANYE
jgi:hypothetical protein